MILPERSPNRLQSFDYSQNGAYFVTICTDGMRRIFWNNSVGAIINRPQNKIPLSPEGQAAYNGIKKISEIYDCVSVPAFVVMPNHVHIMIVIEAGEDGRLIIAPTVSRIVKQYKSAVTKGIGRPIWQKSFCDHIIRSEEDYITHLQYINDNPIKWENNEYY